MLVQMDVRSIVSSAFRQSGKFLTIFTLIVAVTLAYLMLVTPVYESSASLLVKFGQDARPEVAIEGTIASGLSAEEKRGLVQANLNILKSRDLAKALLERMTIAKLYPEIAARYSDNDKAMNAALKVLAADISTKVQADAGTINVELMHEDPELASQMLSQFLDIFIARQAEVFGNPQTDVLAEQAKAASAKLDEANKLLTAFKVAHGITSLDEELTLLLKQRSDIAGYMARRQGAEGNEVQIEQAPSTAGQGLDASAARIGAQGETARFPILEDIQRRIDGLRAKQTELAQTYSANSDVMRNIRRSLAAEEKALKETVVALGAQVADIDRQIAEKQQFRAEYEDLLRQVKAAEDADKVAHERSQSAQLNSDLNERKITRISVIQQPVTPIKPVKPNKPLIAVLGIIAGFMMAFSVALLSEMLDQTFSRAEQLSAVTGRQILASFSRRSRKAKSLAQMDLAALYQSIASSLQGVASPVVALASCYRGEGTSTVARDLAVYAAATVQRRVLLIEQGVANLDIRPEVTLQDVAEGRASLEQALVGEGAVKVACLSAEGQTDQVLSMLDKVRALLNELRASFDLILLPSAGLIQNPVMLGLTRLSDGVVLVVEAERTRAPVVQQMLQQIADAGMRVLGPVLNKRRYYIPGWLYARL